MSLPSRRIAPSKSRDERVRNRSLLDDATGENLSVSAFIPVPKRVSPGLMRETVFRLSSG